MSLELRAAILTEQKRLPEAKALFAQAAQEEKSLGYREPPTYIRPVGEAEGLALMRAGDYRRRTQSLRSSPGRKAEVRISPLWNGSE